MELRGILKSSVITEKAAKAHEKENKYTFKVGINATKGKIKEAVEKLYGVKVIGVNVLKNRPKEKRSWVGSRRKYFRPATKKAIVELKEGDKLKLYEGEGK